MFATRKQSAPQGNTRKKPPPRPPPPNLSKFRSKSTANLNGQQQQQPFDSLIEWSPPNSPKIEKNANFGGSVSSSFSSSTSSLASSKKSFEFEITTNYWPTNAQTNYPPTNMVPRPKPKPNPPPIINRDTNNVPPMFGPTIIRPKTNNNNNNNNKEKKSARSYGQDFVGMTTTTSTTTTWGSESPPMPSIPPPSPPGEVAGVEPYGIAHHDYVATHPSDLGFQAGDVIILLRRENDEWLYGRLLDREGIFPENFVDVHVPLAEDDGHDGPVVTALYDFEPQVRGDLRLTAGAKVTVTGVVDGGWLCGTSGGSQGQFPSNFVDRIPRL